MIWELSFLGRTLSLASLMWGSDLSHPRENLCNCMQKRAVQASDSAVYYCALSDTVREGCGGAEHKPRVPKALA